MISLNALPLKIKFRLGLVRTLSSSLYLSFCKSWSQSLTSPDDELSENIICNTSKATFNFVRLVSIHCAVMRQSLQKSGERESGVMMVLGKKMP